MRAFNRFHRFVETAELDVYWPNFGLRGATVPKRSNIPDTYQRQGSIDKGCRMYALPKFGIVRSPAISEKICVGKMCLGHTRKVHQIGSWAELQTTTQAFHIPFP